MDLGIVRVKRYTSIQDVGKAIHPDYVEGQLQGGCAQGIGWALSEEYIYNKHGHLDNTGFLDYRMPVCSDLPMLDTVIIEVPNPKHPQGASAKAATDKAYNENFADGKKKGKSRPGRVKKSGASCNGSVTALRKRAKNASGEKAKMYHWCANMKSGKKK